MTTNLEYYKVFYYAASCGSLTAAASKLAISQPAVSQALRQLETLLDTKLFTRASRGIHLTPEGQLLFEYVKSEAKFMGCYEVTLNVWTGNTSAERFYEKMGMRTKERQMEYIL